MNEYHRQYVVPAIVVDKYHPELQEYLPEGIQEMDGLDIATYAKGVKTTDLAKLLKLKTYDTALPQHWVDEFERYTGFRPNGQIVWCYDRVDIWGEPVAITREAAVALQIFNHVTKEVV